MAPWKQRLRKGLLVVALLLTSMVLLFPPTAAHASGRSSVALSLCRTHYIQLGPSTPPFFTDVTHYHNATLDIIVLDWANCSTHSEARTAPFELLIMPTTQPFQYITGIGHYTGSNGGDFGYYNYVPLRPSTPTTYTFWVRQCYADGPCTPWSDPASSQIP